MAEVQTPAGASARDTVLMALSFVVLLAGIVAFYWFDEQALPIRIAMVIVGLAAGRRLLGVSLDGRRVLRVVLVPRIALGQGGGPGRDGTGETPEVWVGFVGV